MSTITSRPRTHAGPTSLDVSGPRQGDQRIVLRGVGWHIYDCLSDAIGEGQHVRLAYDGKDLEIMTTGYLHERYKELLGKIVAAVTLALNIDRSTCGETTWKRSEIATGLEADLSYLFDPEKRAVEKAALARRLNNVADYPNPDLAIEIDLSGPSIDRSGIYAKLNVAEVWRFDGVSLTIEHLQEDGSYASVESSRFLPLRAQDVLHWLVEEDSTDELAWERRLTEWAMGLGRRA
jgi:Uma2 family endonuclease